MRSGAVEGDLLDGSAALSFSFGDEVVPAQTSGSDNETNFSFGKHSWQFDAAVTAVQVTVRPTASARSGAQF